MITYRITSKNTSQKLEPISAKERILERATRHASKEVPVGSKVVFNGTKRVAEVMEVITDVEKAHWKKLKPFFIRIKFEDNNQVVITHISSLRKKRK